MLSLLVFLLTLSVLVLVHELGHFLAARKAGIKVEEFGFGYPPRAWSKRVGETTYSLNWIPFGGFVKLYGEELHSRVKDTQRAFLAKSKKARAAVILAGVFGNLLLAIACFSIVYSVSGIPTVTDQVKIIEVAPNSPAQEAGIQEGDLVLAVDGEPVKNIEDFTQKVAGKKGQEVELVLKDGEERRVQITPRVDPPEGQGALGVVVSGFEMKRYPWWQMPILSAWQGMKDAFGWGVLIASSFGKMIINWIGQGQAPSDVGGPVAIFQASAGVAREGVLAILQFMGILSINLMVLNVLPFPALDGGRLVFILYELVARRRPRASIEQWTNMIGMAILLSLLVLVTINDVSRLFKTADVLSRLRPLWPF